MGYCEQNQSIHSFVENLPPKEKEQLIDFFQLLFRHGDFSYTLIGLKPMCSIDYTFQYAKKFPNREQFARETHQARLGFEIWQKYQNLFPMTTQALLLIDNSDPFEHFSIILINKTQCREIISKHKELFKKHIGEKLSEEEIVSLVYEGSIFKKGKLHPEIFGLLLGYPEEDVHAFSAKDLIQHLPYVTNTPIQNRIKLSPCSLGLEKNPLTPIKTPYFMSEKKDTDLVKLKTKFSQKKPDLLEYYYAEDFLERILEKFQ